MADEGHRGVGISIKGQTNKLGLLGRFFFWVLEERVLSFVNAEPSFDLL